jgi:predicted phosphodiesterase
MNSRLAVLWLIPLALGCSGCPKGYWFEVEGDPPPVVDADLADRIIDLAEETGVQWENELYPLVHSEAEPERACSDVLTGLPVRDDVCRSLRPFLSFVHISDSQLKEHSISLYRETKFDEKIYDQFISGAERNTELERYEYASLLATVMAINRLAESGTGQPSNPYDPCPPALGPQFVIHTGDAIDAGMFSELYEFLAIMRQLDVPFYNVIGNHDVLFFGTFPADAMNGHNVVAPFVPIHDARRFMLGHSFEGHEQDISIPFIDGDVHVPTVEGVAPSTLVVPNNIHYHGFDEQCAVRNGSLCPDVGGYYVLEMQAKGEGQDINVRLIVLNTAEITPRDKSEALKIRSRGNMSETQFQWLAEQLQRPSVEPALILVAGHHPMGSFVDDQGNRVETILKNESRVTAYLAGHTHVNEIRQHSRAPGEPPLWEIISGSTMGYPQFGLLLEVLEHTGDSEQFYVRVRTFRQDVGDTVCPSGTENEDLPCLAQRGRLGAEADTDDGAWRSDAQAVQAANGMLRFVLRNN